MRGTSGRLRIEITVRALRDDHSEETGAEHSTKIAGANDRRVKRLPCFHFPLASIPNFLYKYVDV